MSPIFCIKKNAQKISSLFKALGDPNRLAIFSHLCSCAAAGTSQSKVNEIKTCCEVDLSVVSRHLAILRDAGVLLAEKKGKEVYYSLNAHEIASQLRSLADHIEGSSSKPKK